MTKKKKIIIITAAVMAILAAGGITIGIIHKNTKKAPETEVTKDTVSFAEAGTEDMASEEDTSEETEAASAEDTSEEDNTAVSAAERDTEDATPEAAGTSEDAAQESTGNSGNTAQGNGSTGKSTSGNSGNSASGNNGKSTSGNSGNTASGNNGGTGNSGKTTSGNSGKSTSGNSGNAASGNTGKTTSGNSGSSTCNHVWVEVLDLVHYDETGHYENVCVEDAWDEKIVAHGHAICQYCGLDCTAAGLDVGRHCAFCGPIITDPNNPLCGETAGSSWTVKDVVVDTIHHDAVYETQWVVDTPAHEEQVILYYECMKCGATKPAN